MEGTAAVAVAAGQAGGSLAAQVGVVVPGQGVTGLGQIVIAAAYVFSMGRRSQGVQMLRGQAALQHGPQGVGALPHLAVGQQVGMVPYIEIGDIAAAVDFGHVGPGHQGRGLAQVLADLDAVLLKDQGIDPARAAQQPHPLGLGVQAVLVAQIPHQRHTQTQHHQDSAQQQRPLLGIAGITQHRGKGEDGGEQDGPAPQLLAPEGVKQGKAAECGPVQLHRNIDGSLFHGGSPYRLRPAGDAASDPKVTLVYAEVNPLDTIVGQTASYFKEQVESLSGGSILIDLQASGVLGSENDVLDNILAGGDTIDLSRISAFALTSYGCKKSMLLSLPYTFVTREHWWNFANSDLAPDFLNEPQELGLPVRGIFYGEEGFRHFFTVEPVSGIEDLAGMKLRVSNDPVMNGLVEGLGATPTVVSFNELYSALQTGVVDGAEQPIANYASNAFPEVANNLILDGHTLGAVQVIITDNAWAKLTANQQNVILEAGKAAQEFNAGLSEDEENRVLEELKAEGCNVVDVPDKTAWQEACAQVITDNTAGLEDLYQQLVDMA